jgi:exocyst complex protein 7
MDSYQSTLKLLVQEFETGSDTEFQLGVVLTKIMQALKNNLDGKSKQYKDPALMCIFLANNVHYMVTSVRRYVTFVFHVYIMLSRQCAWPTILLSHHRSEAKNILGEEWIQRHRRIVQQNANQYKRVAWSKVCFMEIFFNWMYCFPFLVYCSMFGLMSFFCPD